MELHESSTVYGNLVLMMAHRGVVIPKETILGTESVIKALNDEETVSITGTRPAGDIRGAAAVTCILLSPSSKYLRTGDFRKLVERQISVMSAGGEKLPLEVILVSKDGLSTHVKREIDAFKLRRPDVLIEDHTYRIFLINVTKHVSVPEHSIASEEEVARFCHSYCTSKDRFQKILTSDAQAVWLGVRSGMVVKILRQSETAGTALVYRYCVKG